MIATIEHRGQGDEADRILLVMLPGVGIEAGEFATMGMVDAVHARYPGVDIVATRPDLDLYLEGGIADALHRMIVRPALAEGRSRIWLLGISLGGMGALLHACQFPAAIEGLVLIAPFLGTQGTVAEIVRAGSLAAWSVEGSTATAQELQVLKWLRGYGMQRPPRPALYLGYGDTDRFVDGHRMLAAHLPANRVFREPGGHDWETWLLLWQQMLDASLFAMPRDAGYHPPSRERSGRHG